MKNIVILSILCCFFVRCKKTHVTYDYLYQKHSCFSCQNGNGCKYSFIPEHLKIEHRNWVKETISNASYHLTAGKYKNVDETIEQIEETAYHLFSETEDGLMVKASNSSQSEFIPLSQLNKDQKKVYDSIKPKW